MGEQLDIFGRVATESREEAKERVRAKFNDRQERPSIDERWAEFHAANPHVFAELLRLARARLARGEGRIGVKALWEELRSWLSVTGQDVYKLNNDYTSLYARALIERDPALASLIEVRRRKTDD